MLQVEVNLIAVLAAAIASMAIGMLWYSPLLFGKQWMELSGRSEKEMKQAKKGIWKTYSASFIMGFVMAYVLAMFLEIFRARLTIEAMQIAFMAWVGFVATTIANDFLYSGKPMKLYWINAGYYAVSLIAMGMVLFWLK
ncbi:MAG: DUF1761 domain-containing protein [Candidatus Aenigmarchaeota archaeon]|nr:DUF1761 domain-containing protein [Candidatus Aenigmarchaeota archaeon]